MSVDDKVNYYAEEIRTCWMKTITEIMNVARLCAKAEGELTSTQKGQLLEKLDLDKSRFSKLVKIGSDERLQDDEVIQRLPAKYSVIYEISQLGNRELQEALDQKIIHPKVVRKEIAGLKDVSQNIKPSSPKTNDIPQAAEGICISLHVNYEPGTEPYTVMYRTIMAWIEKGYVNGILPDPIEPSPCLIFADNDSSDEAELNAA